MSQSAVLPVKVELEQRVIDKIINYHSLGLSIRDIEKLVPAQRDQIHKVVRAWSSPAERKGLEIFKANKADVLAMFQRKLLYGITDEQLRRMTVQQRILGFAILFDKERLIRGQPTQISMLASVVADLRTTKKEVQERMEQLRKARDTDVQ